MNIIAKLLSFTRVTRNDAKVSDVKIDPGGGANVTAEHFSGPGDDSFPLITDYVIAVDIPRTGGKAVVGYIDPINEPVAQPGDKRIYARDANTGAAVVSFWLKNDGSGVMSNAAGSIELKTDGIELTSTGNVVINGVTIDPTGNITSPAKIDADEIEATTSLIAATLELVLHTHLAGVPPGDTGPNK